MTNLHGAAVIAVILGVAFSVYLAITFWQVFVFLVCLAIVIVALARYFNLIC